MGGGGRGGGGGGGRGGVLLRLPDKQNWPATLMNADSYVSDFVSLEILTLTALSSMSKSRWCLFSYSFFFGISFVAVFVGGRQRGEGEGRGGGVYGGRGRLLFRDVYGVFFFREKTVDRTDQCYYFVSVYVAGLSDGKTFFVIGFSTRSIPSRKMVLKFSCDVKFVLESSISFLI